MKQQYKIRANAKINLGLNVLSKKENGYHDLDMIVAPISLYDTLRIEVYPYGEGLSIVCRNADIPTDSKNILWKVYKIFYETTALQKKRMKIFLKKEIPREAGLGGGSSDGAFFLKFLNRLHQFPLNLEKEIELAANIGADLPFFLKNKVARVQGIGEKIDSFSFSIEWKVILIKPPFGFSTKEVYELSDGFSEKRYSDFERILSFFQTKKYDVLEKEFFNTLEQALLEKKQEVVSLKNKIQSLTNKKPFLTGSGSTYCIFVKPTEAKKLKKICQKHFKDCQIKLCSFL